MRWTILFILMVVAQGAWAQGKAMEKADRLFDEASYPAAIDAYLKAVDEEPGNSHGFIRLADSYRLTDDFRNALRWYARAVKMKGVEGEVWFHYGEVLMINRKYAEAIPWLEKYQKRAPEDDRVEDMIASCKNQEAFAAGKSLYLLRRVAVNSEASDFGPAFLGKSVVFASSRKRAIAKSNRTGESFLDLYAAPYSGKPELGEPQLFRGGLNTPVHEANPTFTADGKEMFFTRNLVKKGTENDKNAVVQLALFHAKWDGEKWGDATPLPFMDDKFSFGHPALSPDGKLLYFVSNMDGGFGATDLYVVERNGESWGKPENLGQDINSRGNEMFPWVDAKGMLYFASNGRGGLGALDIFMVNPDRDQMGNPENLGAPVNSPYDDFGFIFDDQAGVGFFTSNRLGGKGDDDLYAVTKMERWQGIVVDAEGKPLAGAIVDLREGRSRTVVNTDETGEFAFGLKPNASYLLLLKCPGHTDQRIEFTTKDTENMTVLRMD
ncbi:MAG: carboxypeptidase regulatory-like domain-containing protein [Bacteroidia bacterium]